MNGSRFPGKALGVLVVVLALAQAAVSGAWALQKSNVSKRETVASMRKSKEPGMVVSAKTSTPTGGPITVTVTPCALNGWDISNYDYTVNPPDGAAIGDAPTARGTYAQFVAGPASPPGPIGSLFQHVGDRSDPASGDDATRLRTSNFDGTALAAISAISYWTYVTDFGSGGQATYLQLRVDWDGNGSTDDVLFFEPVYQTGAYPMITGPPVPNQGAPVLGAWQYWDAEIGGWWSDVESAGGPPLIRLSDYAAEHPGATLATDAPSLRLTAGFGGGAWAGFRGNTDQLTFNNTTYNFEPSTISATTTSLTVAPTTSNWGDNVTLTATVNPSDATGTVEFGDQGAPGFSQGFEVDNAGWDVLPGQYTATRVPSGTNGIASKTGNFHAEAAGPYDLDTQGGSAFTRWGGYSSVFPPSGYSTQVDVYLDCGYASTAGDKRIDFSSAINDNTGSFHRDFVFNMGTEPTGFVISGSNNAGRGGVNPGDPGHDPIHVTTSGWYTLKHRFYNDRGVLACQLSLLDGSGTLVHSWVRRDPTDLISGIGGNRYGWFAAQELPFLAIDNSSRSSNFVGSAPVIGGVATLVVNNLSVGSHVLIASYTGDGCHQGSVSNKVAAVVNTPTISISDVSKAEGNAGTTAFVFTVSLSSESDQPVTVDYQTADGSATLANNDYAAATGTLTIPAKTLSDTITVQVNGDTKFESDETFTVNLSNATNASISDGQAVGTIRNDDTGPKLSISDVSKAEGDAGTTAFTFTVSLSNQSDQAVSVDYQTHDGTATLANNDYVAASGTVTIPAKTSSTTLTVNVVGDLKFEANETFTVTLANPVNATILDGTGVGTIVNDDTKPTLTISDVSAAEGNVGTTAFTFTITLDQAAGKNIFVNYQTVDGTATTADNDYQSASGVATIPAKTLSTTITVDVNGDLTNEPDETFFVNLYGAANATITDGQGQGTILNDDDTVPPNVTVVTPNGGETVIIGSPTKLAWVATDNILVTSVDLYLSRNGVGGPYEVIALGEPNDGTYLWTVTGPTTSHAILRVVAHDVAGNTGSDDSNNEWTIDVISAVLLSRFDAETVNEGVALRWQFSDATELRSAWVERADRVGAAWSRIDATPAVQGGVSTVVDRSAVAGQTYLYRIAVALTDGRTVAFEPIIGTAGSMITEFAISRLSPNPAPNGVEVGFTLPREARVRLTIVDVQGRSVATLAEGTMTAGVHQATWNARGDSGPVADGIYFVRYQVAGKNMTRRLVIAR